MLVKRLENFIDRAKIISSFTHNTLSSVVFMLNAKSNKFTTIQARYKGLPFTFRGLDYSAVREVLHDDEYTIIESILKDKEQPCVLDVGANIGLFGIKVLSVKPNARILSVEASPKTYTTLKANVEQNTGRNWRAINAAAWKNDEDIFFSEDNDSMSHHVSNDGKIKVRGVDLHTLINDPFFKNQHIDMMKVDIEGAEEAFICSADSLLKNVESLIIELHPNYCDVDRVRSMLENRYQNISLIPGRQSTKPLLLCQN